MELGEHDSDFLSWDAPVDVGCHRAELRIVGTDVLLRDILIGVSSLQTSSARCAELYLRHVEPTFALGNLVELRSPSARRSEGLIQGYRPAGLPEAADNVIFSQQATEPQGERDPVRGCFWLPMNRRFEHRRQIDRTECSFSSESPFALRESCHLIRRSGPIADISPLTRWYPQRYIQ